MSEGVTYDLAVAWTWKYDSEFVTLIRRHARTNGLRLLELTAENIRDLTRHYELRELTIGCLLDRASDEDEAFAPLARLVLQRFRSNAPKSTKPVNPHDLVLRAADKATMHLEFLAHGIHVPYTIIISPYNHEKEIALTLNDLSKLGRSFIIKPANTTGGGVGVVVGAETLKEVFEARQGHPNDKFLLQETIKPAYLGDNRAWFRVFFAFGEIIPCWWDDQTHAYEAVTEEDERLFVLQGLRTATQKIQSICKLDFFSTELVHTMDGRFVAIDYVNEICDMRLQSLHPDGVVDSVADRIAAGLAKFAHPSEPYLIET